MPVYRTTCGTVYGCVCTWQKSPSLLCDSFIPSHAGSLAVPSFLSCHAGSPFRDKRRTAQAQGFCCHFPYLCSLLFCLLQLPVFLALCETLKQCGQFAVLHNWYPATVAEAKNCHRGGCTHDYYSHFPACPLLLAAVFSPDILFDVALCGQRMSCYHCRSVAAIFTTVLEFIY